MVSGNQNLAEKASQPLVSKTEISSHAIFLRKQIKFQLTWLSGCGGGNGVYSFLVFFFFGSLRFFKFFRLNLGKNLSQLCDLSSGSFTNSLLIIKVFSSFRM